MKRALLIIFIILLGVSILAGCGGSDDGLSGKYVLKECEISGEDRLTEVLANSKERFNRDTLYFELKSGKKYQWELESGDSGKYEVDGNTITLIGPNEDKVGTINGNKITFGFGYQGADKYVFVRE